MTTDADTIATDHADKALYVKECIEYLRTLKNLRPTQSDNTYIHRTAEDAYNCAHRWDPRKSIHYKQGDRREIFILKELDDTDSQIDLRMKYSLDRVVDLLRPILKTENNIDSCREDIGVVIDELEDLYRDLGGPEHRLQDVSIQNEKGHIESGRDHGALSTLEEVNKYPPDENTQSCVTDDGSSPIHSVTEAIVDTNISDLPPRAQRAWDQYIEGFEAHLKSNPTDDEVYDLLKGAFTANNSRHKNSSAASTLPERDTWKRNLRLARQAFNQQKNSPQHPSRIADSGSVVHMNQI